MTNDWYLWVTLVMILMGIGLRIKMFLDYRKRLFKLKGGK